MVTIQQLRDAKEVAKRDFGSMPGVEGIGIGDGVLRIYVRDANVIDHLPRSCEKVDLEFVVTGDVSTSDP
ncbi:MAG TPA: hypothetical protein VGQ36_27910 [Thermoanaerobaculia bacterium]|jgi:hypothetical protein|nr:hypothetical protein [Thermoanaerobaculia bacterium]